jgi:hypothetical protein
VIAVYADGRDVQPGDRIRFHGEPGYVEFVVTERTGDESLDWFVEEFHGGGAMIVAKAYGRVFLGLDQLDGRLELESRADA